MGHLAVGAIKSLSQKKITKKHDQGSYDFKNKKFAYEPLKI
jgi:hypothetical protein